MVGGPIRIDIPLNNCSWTGAIIKSVWRIATGGVITDCGTCIQWDGFVGMSNISRWHSARNPCHATMIRLQPRQRTALGDTLRALANLVATALVLGQFVTQQSPSLRLITAGLTAWVGFVSLALWLIGED